MASITRRGKKWRAQVRTDGINTSRSFDSKREAEAWAFSPRTTLARLTT